MYCTSTFRILNNIFLCIMSVDILLRVNSRLDLFLKKKLFYQTWSWSSFQRGLIIKNPFLLLLFSFFFPSFPETERSLELPPNTITKLYILYINIIYITPTFL